MSSSRFRALLILLLAIFSWAAQANWLFLVANTPGLSFGAANVRGIQVDVGSHSSLQWERTQPWTASVFVVVSAAPAIGGASIIFTTANSGAVAVAGNVFAGYEWWIDENCKQRVRLINNFGTNNYLGVIGSTTFCDGKQHKLAVSYDGSSTFAGIKIYVDGNVDSTANEGTTLSASIINTQPFIIGNQRGWPYALGGTLRHFSLSNIVRNQSWVQSYTTAAASVDANTVLAYDFMENGGKTTADASSSGFTASVDNAVWQPSGAVGNAPFIPQGAVSSDTTGTASAFKIVTLPGIVASGSVVAGAAYCACTTNLTVTDDKSNSYTVLGPNIGLAGVKYWYFYALNVTNGPSVITTTLSSGTGTFWRAVVDEIANVQAIDGNNNTYTASASGTDGITSGSLTTTVNNDFIYGTSTKFDVGTIVHGTNFSIQENTIPSTDNIFSEYFWQPTAGSIAATLTPSATTRAVATGIAFKTQ